VNVLRLAIVTCGFLGCSPVAPGTFGTLGGVAIALALAPRSWFLPGVLVACVLLYVLGRSLGPWAERRAGDEDPGFFVLDEVIGYLITIAWIRGPSLFALGVGFCLFRFFDVLKPPPARRMEAIGGGDGILLDDVMAGLWGLAVMIPLRLWAGEPSLWEYHPAA
jgi:phosphatidylglycerophosphatase A